MPYVTILILGIAAGIAGYAGLAHLLIGVARQPRDHTELVFALLSLWVAAYTLAVLALHTAPSVAAYLVILKYAFAPLGLTSLVWLMWFVAYYTGARPPRFLPVMTVWLGLVIALHLSLPFGILYTEVSGLRPITLPWGEQIVIAGGTPSSWRLTFDLFQLALFAFFGYALVRQYGGGDRRPALVLGLALAMLLAARVADTLLVLGLIDSILTSALAFVGIVIAMSMQLSYSVTRTEIELHTYQRHLHELVAARTVELTQANVQLAQEIRRRALLDTALERRIEELSALKQIADTGIRMSDLTTELQAMCATTTALFAARVTLILIPSRQAHDLRVVAGFERGAGPLDTEPLDAVLANMPLADRGLPGGKSLVLSGLQSLVLPPTIHAFVTTYQLHSIMHIPLIIRSAIVGVMAVATDQAGRTFTGDEVGLAETIAADISAAIDNTRLYQQAVAARERLTVLYESAQAISRASLDPQQVYAELHRAIERLMPTEALVIALYDAANQEVDHVYLADADGRWPGDRSPLANTFAGYMLRRNASVRIDDFSAFPQTEFAFELFGNQPDTESGVAVLLRGSEQVLGLLFVQSYAKGAYTDEDEESLKLLAAHAAIALENARRYGQARALAAGEERTRLAHELHDSVTQTLFSASLITEALPGVWERSAAEGARNLAQLRQLVRGALAEMRTLLFELRPAALVAADLGTLLKQLGQVLTGHTHIPVELIVEGAADVPVEVKIALYRIAREALNNIAKHAGASQVTITLHAAPGALFLALYDDGLGFDPATVPADRMGLRIMAERAATIGAQLSIESAPKCGTEVAVSWPAE